MCLGQGDFENHCKCPRLLLTSCNNLAVLLFANKAIAGSHRFDKTQCGVRRSFGLCYEAFVQKTDMPGQIAEFDPRLVAGRMDFPLWPFICAKAIRDHFVVPGGDTQHTRGDRNRGPHCVTYHGAYRGQS